MLNPLKVELLAVDLMTAHLTNRALVKRFEGINLVPDMPLKPKNPDN